MWVEPEKPEVEVLVRHFPSDRSTVDIKVDGRWCPIELLLTDAIKRDDFNFDRLDFNTALQDVVDQSSFVAYLLVPKVRGS